MSKTGDDLAKLADKLQTVRGGRFILALATGVINLVPVAGSATVEYKNLHAAAATDEQIGRLANDIASLESELANHGERIDDLFSMVTEIASRLQGQLGAEALEPAWAFDDVADALLRPAAPTASVREPIADASRLVDEGLFEPALAALDGQPAYRTDLRIVRLRALGGLGRYRVVYGLLRKESTDSLVPDEHEMFIWACFELGFHPEGIAALREYEAGHKDRRAKLFALSVKTRFRRS